MFARRNFVGNTIRVILNQFKQMLVYIHVYIRGKVNSEAKLPTKATIFGSPQIKMIT